MDMHEAVCALKVLAEELGRTPTADQFRSHVHGAQYFLKQNKGDINYTKLCQEAALVPNTTTRKITNDVFKVNVDQHVENFVPTWAPRKDPWPTIASISDIHWPFASVHVVTRFLEYVGDELPELVILNGDAWDMYSHSKFPRSHNVFTPREEQARSRSANEDFWLEVKRRSPKSKCVQLMGNHDIRPLKRILEEYPEAEDWVREKMGKLFTFDGVKTILDHREELAIQDIRIFHGYRGKLGDHRDFTLFNTMNGHTHKGGVVFRRIRGQTLWELNSGLAGDPESKGLTYTPQKISDWTWGFSNVNKRGPQFVMV